MRSNREPRTFYVEDLTGVLPEGLVGDLVDLQTEQLLSGVFEDVLQEALRASALVSDHPCVGCLPHATHTQPDTHTQTHTLIRTQNTHKEKQNVLAGLSGTHTGLIGHFLTHM